MKACPLFADQFALTLAEQLVELNRRRTVYPDSPPYAVGFWRRVLGGAGLPAGGQKGVRHV
jgi:hypothetical protein